jgi:predicted ATPase/DNA-binding SARP family transcriptional activator
LGALPCFRVLGPVEVWAGDRQLVVGGGRQLKLLAFLVVNANRAVSTDALIDAVWGPEPDGARKRLQMAVTRLRKALAPLESDGRAVLQTVSSGYLLSVGSQELDADVFLALVEQGRRALEDRDPARASELLSEALGLWRGPALAEVAFENFAQAEIRHLEQRRLSALETRIEADLERGRHAELIAELEALLDKQPTRERLAGQLMRAHYWSGGQADALEVYQRTRARLAEELGLEPGPALKALQAQILEQAPSLRQPNDQMHKTSNLPAPATPFLGRANELTEVTSLLRQAGLRMLTLTGPGGSGKTRLALEVARSCAGDYRDGVWFVGFADIANPELIIPAICQTFNLSEQRGVTPTTQLRGWMRERELLLVLDNLEQLAAGTAVLGELLADCRGVRIVATSREPLRLGGEQQYDVPVLDRADAIDLFTARAQAVSPRSEVGPDLADAICERLDRVPLAIELAAARIKALSAEEMLQRLDRRLALLTGGPRNAPTRQRTMRATIDWSHGLLSREEQRLFARMAVFSGGCTLAAAEIVLGADLDVLQSLVDRSLVRSDDGRYRMLQTLHEYALERLEESGEEPELRQAHASWLIKLLEQERLPPPGRLNEHSLMRVAAERENVREALESALLVEEFETLARLAASVVGVWVATGQLQEATRWMAIALEHENEYPERLAAEVVSAARSLAWNRGEFATADTLARRALRRWRELGDLEAIGSEIVSTGVAASTVGDTARARSAFEEAAGFARDHGLSEILVYASTCLADLAIQQGRLEEGRSLSEECCAAVGRESVLANAPLVNLGYIEMLEGRPVEAAGLARAALESALRRGDLLYVAAAGIELAWPLAELGDLTHAARLLGSVLGFLERSGARREWMDQSCEAAVRQILRDRLDARTVQKLLDEGASTPLEVVARDVLGHPIETASVVE